MQSKFGKKKVVKIAVIAGVVVLVLAGGGMVIAGKMGRRTVVESSTDSNRSYEVKKGTISTTVSGTGTLEADDVQDINVLSLLTVDKVYVEAGDVVEKGDLLATVDTVSVKSALQTLQSELESLDAQIEDEKDETVSTKIKSSVSGRVKKIYAKKGDGVTDVMQQDGALALLSLDGKMAVEIETSESVSVGDDVTVTLSDGSTVDGTVETASGTRVVITMTDNGPAYGDTVTVSKDGKTLGSGDLYIHSELTVTGYTGTVSSVSVKENQKVSDGTVLFKLKSTGKTATYEKLVAERAEVAEALGQVVALYNDPNLYAEFSGTVQSVNCEDAEVVKTESDSTTASDSSSTTADSETDSAAGSETSSDEKTDSATESGTSTDSNGSSVENTKGATSQSDGVQGTAAVTGTVYDADSAIRTMQAPGGFVSLGATSVAGGFVQVSATDSAVQTQAAETENQSAATENASAADGSNSTAASGSGTTESNMSADTSGDAEHTGSGSTSGSTNTEENTVISSLQTIVISTPVTGNKVQTGVNSGTGYSAEISWSPSVSQTYAAKTAYTATLTAKTSNGYVFDGKLAETYLKAVTADQAQTKAEVSADGKTLTVTAVFAETADSTQTGEQQETQQSQGTQQAVGGKMSGGSMSGGAASGYSVSSAAGAASSANTNTDTETTEETLNSYTATTTAFSISKDEKMKVSVSVDEQDILNLSVGQTAQVTLDAVDDETFEGTVTAVNTASGEASNGVTKYTAEVTMDKTDQMLQGMNASVVVTISSAEDCLIIPEAALQENGKTTTVYTTYDASTGTYGGETEVTTGVSDGTSVEILSGLSEGDTVYYSYTESSSDNFGFGMDMGSMQMPGGDMSDRQGKSGGSDGNGPQGGPGGGNRQ